MKKCLHIRIESDFDSNNHEYIKCLDCGMEYKLSSPERI